MGSPEDKLSWDVRNENCAANLVTLDATVKLVVRLVRR